MSRVPPIRIFVSYSHVDKDWFAKLRPLLKFRPEVTIPPDTWHDQELKAGDRWEKEIKDELGEMDVFLCVVSYNFLASDFINGVEVAAAKKREKNGEIVIVPLLIEEMYDKDIEYFKQFSPLPAWGRSWRSYELDSGHTMDAHVPIRKGLYEAIGKAKEIQRKRLGIGGTKRAGRGRP